MSTALITPPAAAQVSTWLTPASFEAADRIATLMTTCGTMPAHIKNKGDAFRIVVQAAKWQMDPFSVAECTSLVHGRMCYEGKLIAAVLRSMNAIEGRLTYEITGEGQASKITVTGKPTGADRACSISGSVQQWRTKTMKDGKELPNNWDKDPHSQLVYRGTRQWARIYAPEAIMGIYTPDELEEVEIRDVTATATVHAEPPPARRRRSVEATAPEQSPAAAETAPAQSASGAVSPAVIDAAPAAGVGTGTAPAGHVSAAEREAALAAKPAPAKQHDPFLDEDKTVEECGALANAVHAVQKLRPAFLATIEKWKLASVRDLGGVAPGERTRFFEQLRAAALAIDPKAVLP